MSGHTYDLSCIEDKNMKDIFEYGDDSDKVLETLKLKQHLWRYNGSTYYIIKYDDVREKGLFNKFHCYK